MKIKTTNHFTNNGSSLKWQRILIYCQIKLEYRPKSDQVKKIQRGSERETQTENTIWPRLPFLVLHTGLKGKWWPSAIEGTESTGRLMWTVARH